jgi:multisubunit Na+/H+ antiporter MnhC subunit
MRYYLVIIITINLVQAIVLTAIVILWPVLVRGFDAIIPIFDKTESYTFLLL